MTKIKEIVQINSGYASYVVLRRAFFNEEERRVRMERYKPITAHRIAFEKISNAINPLDKRFYFLTGSYGTGKSHLCLMLSNYFAHQSELPELKAFFKNYKDAQDNVKLLPGKTLKDTTSEQLSASNLIAKRRDGRYLVALCDFGWNLDFEGTILRAIMEALEIENFSSEVDTFYQEASRKIDELKLKDYLYNPFLNSLSTHHPDWTENKLKDRLSNYDEEALNIFKTCFKDATTIDFAPQKANMQLIIDELISNEKFKKSFKGITIVYDEFGYALDSKSVDLNKLHAFAEFCSKSAMESLPVTFIGTGHKAFKDHGEVGDKVHFNTITARVEEVALRTEGMEDIIGAIIQPKKDSQGWIKEVEPNSQVFAMLPTECKKVNIFNWLPAPVLKNNIIVNIFPMHPMATYGLVELAKSIGSDNRSVFKFFSPEFETGDGIWDNAQKFSYPWFVGNNDILNENNILNFLTLDIVFDYFAEESSIDSNDSRISKTVKSALSDYKETYRELKRYITRPTGELQFEEIDELMESILKAMLVHEIITNDKIQIQNNLDTLYFSLNAITPQEQQQIENRINKLTLAGIIYKNADGGFFELKRGDGIDVRRLVDEYMSNPDNKPQDVVDIFVDEIWKEEVPAYFDAKDYNMPFSEDKRLKVEFLSAAQLEELQKKNEGDASVYFEKIRKAKSFGKDYYEGTAVIVYCENQEQIDRAKLISKNAKGDRVFFGIPQKPINISKEIFNHNALNSIQESKDYENFSSFEKAELNELNNNAYDRLKKLAERYSSNNELIWLACEGALIALAPNKQHDIANYCCNKIYKDLRNQVPHKDFNKAHQIISGGALERILGEACDLFSDTTQPITIDHSWADNRGGTSYIKKLFVDKPILSQTNSDGDKHYYQLKKDISGFSQFYPGLTYLIEQLNAIEKGKPIKFREFIKPLFAKYGLGEISISLFLLLAKRHFGDSLVFKNEEYSITQLEIADHTTIFDLVKNKYPNAVTIIQDISSEDKDYFTALYKLFSPNQVEAGKEYGLTEAFNSVQNWWQTKEIVVASDDLHTDRNKPYVRAFNKMETFGTFAFIKSEIPGVIDIEENEKITSTKLAKIISGLQKFKEDADNFLTENKELIIERMNEIFDSEGVTDEHLIDAMKAWSEDLDSGQKDKYSKFQTTETKALLTGLTVLSDLTQFLFETLPTTLNYGSLKDWSTDHHYEYIQKVKTAKKLIDDNKIKVSPPIIKYNGDVVDFSRKLEYAEKLNLEINLACEDIFVYITEDGSDPTMDSSNRKKVTTNESLTIKGNKQLKFVSIDNDGNYGYIQKLNIFDKNEKVKVIGHKDVVGDIVIPSFIFPKDRVELESSLKTYLEIVLREKIATKEEIESIINDILS